MTEKTKRCYALEASEYRLAHPVGRKPETVYVQDSKSKVYHNVTISDLPVEPPRRVPKGLDEWLKEKTIFNFDFEI